MNPFEIVEKDGIYAIKALDSCVIVLPYTLDQDGSIDSVGMVKERNPHQQTGFYIGPVMGTLEKDDRSIIHRAKKELTEETGYNVEELEKWVFLGEMVISKTMPDPIYFYAVDITGKDSSSPQGDGSPQEEGIEFMKVPLSELAKTKDVILNACFFKLFTSMYKNQII